MTDIRKIQEQRLYEAVKFESDEFTATEIVYGGQNAAPPESDAEWVKSAMGRLEKHFDRFTAKQIRMNCQCGYQTAEKLALVQASKASSSGLDEFISQDKVKAAGLSYANGAFYLQFSFCSCPMLADVDKLDTETWCQCSTGYSNDLFDKAFGCKVRVELLKSIKMGDDVCLMKIIPCEPIWK